MRNKSAITFFTVIISLLCVYYISFTFVARRTDEAARVYATGRDGKFDPAKEQNYLDSLTKTSVFLGKNYQEVKEQELNLGLDLQGGMSVTLEVSPADIIKSLASNSKDTRLQQALQRASERQKTSSQPYAQLFQQSFNEVAPGVKLNSVFNNAANRDRITSGTSDVQVMKIINDEVEGAIDRSFQIIRNRIDKFGTASPNIQKLPGTGRIQVELPGVDDPARVRKLLSGVARLEFLEVWNLQEISPTLQVINDFWVKQDELKNAKSGQPTKTGPAAPSGLNALKVTTRADSTKAIAPDSTALAKNDTSSLANKLAGRGKTTAVSDSAKKDSALAKISPLFKLARPNGYDLQYLATDTAKINALLQDPRVVSLVPGNIRFFWGVKANKTTPDDKQAVVPLYALKQGRDGRAPLTGEVITDARLTVDQGAGVSMQMNSEGAKKWKRLTGANVNRRVAIVLDGYVYSAPNVQGEIPNGSSSITGDFTMDEAKDLANVLKAGKMPAPTRIVEEAIVGPSLGKESISQGLTSMLVGLVLVAVFMVLYYSTAGLVANLALLFNVFFVIGILASLKTALTLPGIAGIVLTIGMSVDANVLIFERIREELRNGRDLLTAIRLGYDRAFSSIIDSNVTTFLTGLILFVFGTGGVRGFATVLMLGILSSLFTAVFISRLFIEYLCRKGANTSLKFSNSFTGSLFLRTNFDFVGNRKKFYLFSGVLIGTGLVLIAVNGLTLGVDFKGGRTYVVQFAQPVSYTDVRAAVESNLKNEGLEVKTFGADNKLKITTSYLIDDESGTADKRVEDALLTGLNAKFAALKPSVLSSSKVGATIADDIKGSSVQAIIGSLVMIFLYLLLRFRRWQYSLGAVVATFHDTLIVISFFAFAKLFGVNLEVDQVFVAAVLTVIGYSITDTVVVFDRIREFAGGGTREELSRTLNTSINNTLSRTLITSLTVFLVVFILFIFGGEVLRGFSFAMLVGVFFGSYSSICVAAPIVLDFSSETLLNKTVPAGKVDVATQRINLKKTT